MTGKVLSLSRARKTRARDDRKRKADENAARFGRTRAEREAEAARAAQEAARLEAHRRDEE
ncbi:DUF4169 family protein [Roseicyclus sp.]|uniref:DUF4169 family protein n=1 Tax=Roseicyclus sp. TaxID=1914329 RepID=UPI003FA07678